MNVYRNLVTISPAASSEKSFLDNDRQTTTDGRITYERATHPVQPTSLQAPPPELPSQGKGKA